MKKRVEVYFVIYLATIISFFALESQIKKYKKNQMYILTELAINEQLIRITSPSVNQDEKELKLRFSLDGAYEEESFEGYIHFTSTDSLNISEKFALQSEENYSHQYSLIMSKDEIPSGIYQLAAKIHVKPIVTPKMEKEWFDTFKDNSIVDYLKESINNRGKIELSENLISNFKLGLSSQFAVIPYENIIYVINDMQWKNTYGITGVLSDEEYNIEILMGTELISQISKSQSDITFYGIAHGQEMVTFQAHHVESRKTITVSFLVDGRDAQWETENEKEYFFGENVKFNGGLIGIDDSQITVKVSGLVDSVYNSPFINVGKFDRGGSIYAQVYLNGYPVPGMNNTIHISPYPPPLVEFVQQNKNKLIYQFTTFGEVDGKPNGLKHLQRISGIESVQQLGSKIQEGRKFVERYEIAVLEKDSEYVKHRDVRFAITDRRGERTEESVRIQY